MKEENKNLIDKYSSFNPEEMHGEPIRAKYEFYVRDREDEKELDLMLKAREMSILLWNIKMGIDDMRNGKNGLYYGFYRYYYKDEQHQEYTLDEILDRMSEYIHEELDDSCINLND